MPDLILESGTEITFDLKRITLKEWLGIFNTRESDTRTDKTLAKACGLEYKEFEKFSFYDYKQILAAFFKKCNEPLTTPNSPSASTLL